MLDSNGNGHNSKVPINVEVPEEEPSSGNLGTEVASQRIPPTAEMEQKDNATRSAKLTAQGLDKSKLLLLGGGLLVAVLFFVFTVLFGNKPTKKIQPPSKSAHASTKDRGQSDQPQGSVTPLMDTVHPEVNDKDGGKVTLSDIARMKHPRASGSLLNDKASPTKASESLREVPAFESTQQKWEEPKPYGSEPANSVPSQQEQNSLKEASLIFVRNQTGQPSSLSLSAAHADSDQDTLELPVGTRIQAKLEAQVLSVVATPVDAVVEYTYSIGDHVLIPAGTHVYGTLAQADKSGYVDIRFSDLEMGGRHFKIDAIGTSLDLGPIRGSVSGKNTGRNFLVRAGAGIGSVAAMLVGNNNSGALSEEDMLRERIAGNIGQAGDTQIMSMAANSRWVVSVPADSKIFIVFTKRQQTDNTNQIHRVN